MRLSLLELCSCPPTLRLRVMPHDGKLRLKIQGLPGRPLGHTSYVWRHDVEIGTKNAENGVILPDPAVGGMLMQIPGQNGEAPALFLLEADAPTTFDVSPARRIAEPTALPPALVPAALAAGLLLQSVEPTTGARAGITACRAYGEASRHSIATLYRVAPVGIPTAGNWRAAEPEPVAYTKAPPAFAETRTVSRRDFNQMLDEGWTARPSGRYGAQEAPPGAQFVIVPSGASTKIYRVFPPGDDTIARERAAEIAGREDRARRRLIAHAEELLGQLLLLKPNEVDPVLRDSKTAQQRFLAGVRELRIDLREGTADKNQHYENHHHPVLALIYGQAFPLQNPAAAK